MDKGILFANYNKLRYKIPKSYVPRLNRALGVAQLKNSRPYNTTFVSCDCPDAFYRKVICKHILALWIKNSINNTLIKMLNDSLDKS